MYCSFIVDILINLGISILGSAITMTVVYLWKIRKYIEKSSFRNQKIAEKHILSDIKNSKSIRVYAMCGSTFSDKVNSKIAQHVLSDSELKQQYLISDENNDKIADRNSELPKGSVDLKTRVKNSINDFLAAKEVNTKIELRFHKDKVRLRMILLDNYLYLSYQEKFKYGRDTAIQRIPCNTPVYITQSEIFNELWDENKLDA